MMRGRRLRPSDGKYRNGSYSQSDNRSRARSGANIVYLPARTRRATAKRPLDITPICPAPQTQAEKGWKLPEEIVEKTIGKYLQAYKMLTGKDL